MPLGAPVASPRFLEAARRLVLDPVLAAAFPSECVACHKPLDEPSRGALCLACLSALPRFSGPSCPCGAPMALRPGDSERCGRCRRRLTPWSRGASIGPFEGGLRLAIHALKYAGRMGLARTLARVLLGVPGASQALDGATMLVPVPLHRRRRRARGFNQSEVLANALAAGSGIRSEPNALVRLRETAAQTGLSAFARRRNVARAFAGRRVRELSGSVVVLVDDVMTTGATATACTLALREAGAADVRLLTIARVGCLLLAGGFFFSSPRPVQAWGQGVHDEVVSRAVDTLPAGLKPFYKNHKLEIPSLSPDATPREEGVESRFLIDTLGTFPFDDVPSSEPALRARSAEAAVKAGRLPWLIQESYSRLVEAFRSGDKLRILTESDALARHAADLRNPLALSANFDGDKTGQPGLWARFAVRLPQALEGDIRFRVDDAHLIETPKEHPFAVARATYIWLDNLLYLDDLAKRGNPTYNESYYQAFGERAGELLGRLLSLATSDVGSYWYSAWTEAGRPALK